MWGLNNFFFLLYTADRNDYIKEIERNLDEVHDLGSTNEKKKKK